MELLLVTELQRRAMASRVTSELLAPRVRELVKDRHSLRSLGRAVGYGSPSTLFSVLDGGDPPLSVLLALAAVLDLDSLDDLFGPAPAAGAIENLRARAQAGTGVASA